MLTAGAIIAAAALVAAGAGRLARLISQPAIIGYVVAGIAVALLPLPASVPPLASRIGELGALALMFTSGAEIDGGELWKRARRGAPVTAAVIVTPFAIGLAIAPRFGVLRGAHADPLAFVLLVATCLSVTAFPVLIEILRDRRMLSTRVGTSAVATAAFDDFFLWLMLAIIAAGGTARLLAAFLVALPAAVAVARLGFRALERGGHLRAVFVVPGVAAAIALLTFAGVHPLFAAFFLGAAMPHCAATGAILTVLRRWLFPLLPLFFAAIGMHVGAIQLSTLGVAAIFIAVASAAKVVPATFVSRLRGESWRYSIVLGVLLNARGAMELIAAKLGLELGLLSPAGFSVLVSVAVATTVITGPLLRVAYSPSLGSTTAAAVTASDAAV